MSKSPRSVRRPSRPTQDPINLCVYAHFYQPLREDPFTGEVPRESGAEPFANYNEKIDVECYRPNAALGNFRGISFDVGPTLTRWLADSDPATLRLITEADAENVRELGFGNALAQPFHHTILPLATRRDKEIQVDWGIADFVYRLGHPPQGMWLPETAVDLETLDVLAERGIRYTVLAPWQRAGRGREPLDPGVITTPSGHKIVGFFFHSGISNAVSFHPEATESAREFVASRLPEFGQRLILICSDGELYGHHQSGREQFLHDLLFQEAAKGTHEARTLGEFIAKENADGKRFRTARIREKTSWSCHHGVARWDTGCSCTEGDSGWKPALRQALDQLAEGIDELSREATDGLLDDFSATCRDYIGVVLGIVSTRDLIDRHAKKKMRGAQERTVLDLLAAQYYRQAMYTSCAFFWDDPDRIESRNIIGYAARAIGLCGGNAGRSLEPVFVSKLAGVTSWRTGENGGEIYAAWHNRNVVARHRTRSRGG